MRSRILRCPRAGQLASPATVAAASGATSCQLTAALPCCFPGTWVRRSSFSFFGCYAYDWSLDAGYGCACGLPGVPLAWRPLAACLTGAASATGGDWPPVCRTRIGGEPAQPYRAGRVDRHGDSVWACSGADSATSVSGIGTLPWEFQVLCRGAPGGSCHAMPYHAMPSGKRLRAAGPPPLCACWCTPALRSRPSHPAVRPSHVLPLLRQDGAPHLPGQRDSLSG